MILARLILVIVTAVAATNWFIFKFDDEFLFDDLLNPLLFITSVVILAIVIIKDSILYKKTRAFKTLIPSITGVLLAIVITASFYILKQRDNTPTIVFASYNGDFNSVSIDLRENGTYKIASYCMGAEYKRGHYTMKGDIITLDRLYLDIPTKSKMLLITRSKTNLSDDVIYQVDEQGKIIEKALKFIVRADKRKR
jgi:hypothetical protein